MKAKLITQSNELVVRNYSLIEDEGLAAVVAGSDGMGNPGITMAYEDDEGNEGNEGKDMIVITATSLPSILKFVDFIGVEVKILT
jgi:hypothetical protein